LAAYILKCVSNALSLGSPAADIEHTAFREGSHIIVQQGGNYVTYPALEGDEKEKSRREKRKEDAPGERKLQVFPCGTAGTNATVVQRKIHHGGDQHRKVRGKGSTKG